MLTYRYKIRTSNKQDRILSSILEDQRILYNAALQERIDCYKKTKNTISYFDQCKSLTEIRKYNKTQNLKNIPANIQRWTLHKIHHSYNAFFRRVKISRNKSGFPRYRSKNRWRSFGFNEFSGIQLKDNNLLFNELKIHVDMHRPLSIGKITGCVFTKTHFGWYVSIEVKTEKIELKKTINKIGIDVGLTHLATLSDGTHIPNIRSTKKYEKELRRKQRALSRCKKGSNRRNKVKLSVARVYRKIKNTRDTNLHQIAANLINTYDMIGIEKLNIKGMIANPNLSKAITDASWYTFMQYLDYKAERAGCQVIKINSKYTSQMCSDCGLIDKNNRNQEKFLCVSCRCKMQADHNAAINILNRAVMSPEFVNVI